MNGTLRHTGYDMAVRNYTPMRLLRKYRKATAYGWKLENALKDR
jgi:hypothetical protein